jgi:TorA maturation chaperone TorD
MTAPANTTVAAWPPSEEDQARMQVYRLIGALLVRPPGEELLTALQAISASDGQMKAAWAVLRQAASQAVVDDLADEYQELFIGIGRGELLPYGSWYVTGFLMEKPLAELRTDLVRLGFERQAKNREPEDHAAALCETMGLIIASGAEISFAQQRVFFQKHLAPWMGRFFADMAKAKSARFYRAVGLLGEQFLEIERNYLDMPV